MADDFDLFGEDFSEPAPAARPCPRPAIRGMKVCRMGGGLAVFSDDHGRTWFCLAHRPPDFFPADRRR